MPKMYGFFVLLTYFTKTHKLKTYSTILTINGESCINFVLVRHDKID